MNKNDDWLHDLHNDSLAHLSQDEVGLSEASKSMYKEILPRIN